MRGVAPSRPSFGMVRGFPSAALALRPINTGQTLAHSLRQGLVSNSIGDCHSLPEVADRVLTLARGGVNDTQVAQSVGFSATVADRAGDREALRQGRFGVRPALLC